MWVAQFFKASVQGNAKVVQPRSTRGHACRRVVERPSAADDCLVEIGKVASQLVADAQRIRERLRILRLFECGDRLLEVVGAAGQNR